MKDSRIWNTIKKYFQPLIRITTPVEAFVICCNDNPEHVHLGTMDKAKEKLEELAREYYHRNGLRHRFSSYKEYRMRFFWHIRQVDYTID